MANDSNGSGGCVSWRQFVATQSAVLVALVSLFSGVGVFVYGQHIAAVHSGALTIERYNESENLRDKAWEQRFLRLERKIDDLRERRP